MRACNRCNVPLCYVSLHSCQTYSGKETGSALPNAPAQQPVPRAAVTSQECLTCAHNDPRGGRRRAPPTPWEGLGRPSQTALTSCSLAPEFSRERIWRRKYGRKLRPSAEVRTLYSFDMSILMNARIRIVTFTEKEGGPRGCRFQL